jgi:hypothetical protein
MTAILVYWALQIAVWIAGGFIFLRRKEIVQKHKGRKDPRLQRVFMLIFTPIFAFVMPAFADTHRRTIRSISFSCSPL